MITVLKQFQVIAERSWVRFLLGLVLLISAGSEVLATEGDLLGQGLGAHHGVLLFGLMQIVKTLPDFVEGLVGAAGAIVDSDDDGDVP